MAWSVLVGAGCMEAVWAVALAASGGFRRLVPVLVFLLATACSLLGLAYAMRTIPTGTAYAVWTATGAALTVVWAALRGSERMTPVKTLLLLALVTCVVGLKVLS